MIYDGFNMHPDWLKIEEMFKYAESLRKEVTVSPAVYMALENSKVELYGVTIRSSPLFHFETHWDACDIGTRQQIQIPSGEWIHGVMMSPMNFNDIERMPLPIQFYEQDTQDNLRACIFKGRMF